VSERRADEHRARDAPQKNQRLAIGEREGDRDQAVQAEGGEDPGSDVRFREAAARADGKNDGDWTARREKKSDDRRSRIRRAEIGGNAPRPRQR
jgi:hypothetical protein